jgi:hypothetical protein
MGLLTLVGMYGIENYQIKDDGSIDVNGYVDLTMKKLERIPLNLMRLKNILIVVLII